MLSSWSFSPPPLSHSEAWLPPSSSLNSLIQSREPENNFAKQCHCDSGRRPPRSNAPRPVPREGADCNLPIRQVWAEDHFGDHGSRLDDPTIGPDDVYISLCGRHTPRPGFALRCSVLSLCLPASDCYYAIYRRLRKRCPNFDRHPVRCPNRQRLRQCGNKSCVCGFSTTRHMVQVKRNDS